MSLRLNHCIRIGGRDLGSQPSPKGAYRLLLLDSVHILRSVEALADTAEITLPATVYNAAIEIEDKVHVGDSVTISLGYGDNLREEFSGFVQRIATDGGAIKLFCEDQLYLFRQAVADKVYKKPSVKTLLQDICRQCGGVALSCDYDFSYDTFTVHNATGYDILKKIQDEVQPNIYFKDGTLHIHPQYAQIFGQASYNFTRNIERGHTDLEYRKADDRRFLVVVEGEKKDGTKVTAQAGVSGGDRVTMRVPGATDQKSLQAVADQVLKEKSYTGYAGSFQSWLLPFCDAGFKVSIHDPDYEYKNGTYYVTAVEVSYSSAGGVRKITLGRKLS